MLNPVQLDRALAQHGTVVRVAIVEHRGSTPRASGTSMLVWATGQDGTIGGGRLEHLAVAEARAQLTGGTPARLAFRPLGPALGQCCGGAVTLVAERFDAARMADVRAAGDVWLRPVGPEARLEPPESLRRLARGGIVREPVLARGWLLEPTRAARRQVVIHGAGHVGRALAAVLAPLPQFQLLLADTRREMLEALPQGTATHPEPLLAAMLADDTAEQFIMTHDHALDLELCHRLLGRRFGFAGLIGSETKWARFRKRLGQLGHAPDRVARITCPIGVPGLGKAPQAIAIGVAQAMLAAKPRANTLREAAE